MQLVNASGTAVATYEYDPYGNIVSATGDLAETNPLRYRGYYYDKETELYYLQSRYYDPQVGRFINADALVSTGQGLLGNNMFAYCLNNPTNGFDDNGYHFNGLDGRLYSRDYSFQQAIVVGGGGGLCIIAANAIAELVAGVATGIVDYFSTVWQNTYDWFSSAIAGQSVEDKLGSIASSYGNTQCKEAAKEMEEYLKKKGESFSLITIQFPTYPGYIYSNTANSIISENGIHVGILYKGRVYCNVHPLGLFETSWISDFEGVGTKMVTVIPVT